MAKMNYQERLKQIGELLAEHSEKGNGQSLAKLRRAVTIANSESAFIQHDIERKFEAHQISVTIL